MTATRSKAYYAAIDLGSNSFHMLVVRVVAGGVQVVSKIKRKVRLAAGLGPNGELDDDAKQRALACLKIFADRVQDIDSRHIRAVGTATLRKVRHDQDFIAACEAALGHPIDIISGDEEAATIYQGIAHTTSFQQPMLIIDIGGASTELVQGQGFRADTLNSLDMGCVTWYTQFFKPDQGAITASNTEAAIQAAQHCCEVVANQYSQVQDSIVLGASGTFKALQEIAHAQEMPYQFERAWLEQVLAQCVACGGHDSLKIPGLKAARKPVFVSGLCILLGVMRGLGLQQVQPTSGALREGVIYALLSQQQQSVEQSDVQQRTLDTIAATYHLDTEQAIRVHQLAHRFYQQLRDEWVFPAQAEQLLRAVAYTHELGLSLAYKQASAHATYMLQHLDMPGFNQAQRQQLVELIAATAGIIDDDNDANPHPQMAMRHLERVARLAIVLCQRRTNDSVAAHDLKARGEHLYLQAPTDFLQRNPFLLSLLEAEQEQLNAPEQLTFAPLS